MRKRLRSVAGLVGLALMMTIAVVQVRHLLAFGHLAPPTLHADVTVFPWDIGIPGITKGYEAHITNYGFLPLRVERCEFLTDAFERGESVGYKLERWNEQSKSWQQILDADSGYCQPVGLSMVNTVQYTKWLWPGQSLSTGTEATGARDGVKGNSLRFVVIANRKRYPTQPFVIDEQKLESGVPARVRH